MTSPSRPQRPVALLVAAFLLAGLWLDAGVLHLQDETLAWGWPVLIAAVAFAVTEAVVMHVELGKNAHTVSLAELTLVVGLFFVPAAQLPVARLVGGGLVLLVIRKQRPMKIAFNLSLWLLDVAVATLVFQRLGGTAEAGAQALVVPAVLAALAAALVDSVAVNAVIYATSAELEPARALRFLETCLIGSLGCATGGLVAVGALSHAPLLVVPLGLVLAIYLLGFHHLAELRAKHRDVEVIYGFAAELAQARTSEQVMSISLRGTVDVLRAQSATLYLNDEDTGTVRVHRRDELGMLSSDVIDPRDVHSLVRAAMGQADAVVLRAGSRTAFLVDVSAKDAVLAPVHGDGVHGVLVLTDRLGEVNTFAKDDGLLLAALVSHAVTALANTRLVERLDHDSLHDSLTGLANRALFLERLGRALRRTAEGHAVLLMDLDRFKEVNDTLGHHHGDLLLQEIANRLSGQMRKQDLLARLGGDEFAVLIHGLDEDTAVATAERLLRALSEPMLLHGVEMEVGASIGVVHVPPGRPALETDASVLMQRADVAMYAAKKHYTGVHVYRDELDGYSPRRLALASGLRAAIELGQLSLRYQPQARVADGEVIGVEALVRWEHPTYGTVAPDDFISIAEQTGQIRELTRWVLDRSLADVAQWAADGLTLAVSVNISMRNLMEPDLPEALAQMLTRHGVPAGQLTMEVTESHLMSDPARMAEVLLELADLGVRIAVDDFGTGYSSLAYLKQLPVSEVKIDRSFVADLVADSEDAAITEAIIQLAHTLHLSVVAEGVEDEATQHRLAELGCDLLQGYHLARPMTEPELRAWLATARLHERRAIPAPRSAEAPQLSGARTLRRSGS